eukprot:GFUD01027851.1.p1 GENE.GFUD01027851.1~~GFUD01027851.1.p1  ORF type:complete len:531 (+),score=157.62 GFUD01027851.1:64-1656(+)
MSRFSLENEIRSTTRMDSSLNKGPWQRQRKALENSNSSLNASTGLGSAKLSFSAGGAGGGLKRLSESLIRKTPSKTPKRSPSRSGTPSRDGAGTPGRKTPGGGDRFIPNRSATDYEVSHFKILREGLSAVETETMSPTKREYQRVVQENLGADISNTRVLAYQSKPPSAPEGHSNNLKILYSSSKSQPTSAKKVTRHIPQVPERILDAPDIVNDYYLNLVDWSSNNQLAVALGAHIYLWNAGTGGITQLCELEGPEDYVCSLKWVNEGGYLAVGSSSGEVELWDVEQMKRSRVMKGLDSRVASLAWNQWVVSSGSRSGDIQHSDVRVASHCVGRVQGHSQEVCGLAWSPDGRTLASGGNDNILNLWSAAAGDCHAGATPSHSLTSHMAAVKALAWCPWQANTLASGGGTADRCIKIWNTSNAQLVSSTDTKSQVCSLVWAREYRELVSSHGYANNEVIIWRYPTMVKVAELLGHTERVLHTALSPDGSTLVSAGADETLRLWKCFTPDPNKKDTSKCRPGAVSSLRMSIR